MLDLSRYSSLSDADRSALERDYAQAVLIERLTMKNESLRDRIEIGTHNYNATVRTILEQQDRCLEAIKAISASTNGGYIKEMLPVFERLMEIYLDYMNPEDDRDQPTPDSHPCPHCDTDVEGE